MRDLSDLDDLTVTVLDAGGLIAHERQNQQVRVLIELAGRKGVGLLTSSAVVAQVWRGSPRNARLAKLLKSDALQEMSLDAEASRAIGVRCAEHGAHDVVDAHVAVLAADADAVVVTSDPDDLVALGIPRERLLVV